MSNDTRSKRLKFGGDLNHHADCQNGDLNHHADCQNANLAITPEILSGF